ncbi:MAG: ATP-binding protein [Vicinamibacteria bacterium]
MTPSAVVLTIDSRLENLAFVGVAARAIAAAAGLPPEACGEVELCVVEAVTNSIRHAYEGRPGHEVRIRIGADAGRLEIEVRDRGRALPVERLARAPELPEPSREDVASLAESGRGHFLMARLMDELQFAHVDGENVVRMTRLTGAPGRA